MKTVCSKCFIPLEPRTNKIRILSTGAIGCNRCYWEEKGKKKRRVLGGSEPPILPKGKVLSI